MNFKHPWDMLKYLSKPQSIAAGTWAGTTRWLDPKADEQNRLGVGGNPLSGFMAGLKGDINPAEAIKFANNRYDEGGIVDKVAGLGANVAMDPLILAGPLAKAGKLGKLGEAASTFGKLETGATAAEKGAQFGRRFYQGMLATGEPVSAAGTAMLGGFAERRIKAITQLLRKTPGNVEDIVQAENTLSPAALEMGRLFDPADVASMAKNTGIESSVAPKTAIDFGGTQQSLPFGEKPSLEDELMKILSPKKKSKVLIDPMIEDQDIVATILKNAGRRRG